MSEDDYGLLRKVLSNPEVPTIPEGEPPIELSEETRPVARVIKTIFVMHSVKSQHDMEVHEFVESVMTGTEEVGNPNFSSSEFALASTRLGELLEADGSLSRRSKARNVVKEHGMMFCSCRVLTDVRPVFSKNPESEPEDMVIVHTIKLVYHEGGKHKEVFVAADLSDLKKLRDALDRAEKKEVTLSKMLKDKQVKVTDLSE